MVMAVGVAHGVREWHRERDVGEEGCATGERLGTGYIAVAPVSTTLVCRAINRNSFIPRDLYWIRLRGWWWFSLKIPCFLPPPHRWLTAASP